MAKTIYTVNDLSTIEQSQLWNFLSSGQRAILALAPYMIDKLSNDLLDAARAGKNPTVANWITSKGYTLSSGPLVTASTSTAATTGQKTGDLIPVTNPRGGTVNRYLFIDDNGDQWALATKGDQTTADYLYTNGKWEYVDTDENGNIIAPASTTLANKYYDTITGTWKDNVSTDPFANLGTTSAEPTAAEQADIENTQANTAYTQASTQKLLNDLNSPTTTDSQKNDAAIQLYGILTNYINNNNSNAVSQWGNQASAFNQAYGNAIDQNKWLQDMSTSPLNTVAYLNLIRGQMPPNWNLPNYQKMPDAFTGWNQQQPQTQPLPDTAQIQAILQGLGWGNTANTQQGTPVPSVTTPDNVVHQMPYTSPNVWNINPEGTGYTNANTGQNVSAVETQSTQNPYTNQIVEAARLAKQWEPYKDQPTPQGATYRTYKALLDSLTKKAGITT